MNDHQLISITVEHDTQMVHITSLAPNGVEHVTTMTKQELWARIQSESEEEDHGPSR